MLNLMNVSHDNRNKTRNTIIFIESMKILDKWNLPQISHFNKIVNKALSKVNADDMLKAIGYRFRKEPLIYAWCEEIK